MLLGLQQLGLLHTARACHHGHPSTTPTQSRNKAKRTRSSPSKELHRAILLKHKEYPIAERDPRKVDISYVNVRTAGPERFREELERQNQPIGRRTKHPELSLQTILARYIDVVYESPLPQHEIEANPLSEATVEAILPEESRTLLYAKGYTLEDLREWASIIMTKSVQAGAEKFLEHVTDGLDRDEETYKPLPSFLLLIFLQRTDIGPTALRYLVVYAWHQLRRKRNLQLHCDTGYSTSKYPALNDSTMFIMFVRLIRHARQIWPAALVSIAAMVTTNLEKPDGSPRSATSKRKERVNLQRIEYLYNQTLVLLSHPSPITPFHSVRHQERAQFDVLQKMATHRPPLAVTSNGYRAIVTVQLRNRKTPRERDWAQLKSKAWPPWKEDKTGLDADKGPDYGVSRALEAIHRMHEAGYKGGLWEKVAQILAGWDIDGSPTIQTRAVHPHRSGSQSDLDKGVRGPDIEGPNFDPDHALIWAARIRTTRTVQEAWACFLAWEDRKLRPNQDVYLAMFEKLHYEEQRRKAEAHPVITIGQRVDAGDRREVFPVPESPKEATYVRTHPPILDDLATDMYSKGVLPQGRCLDFLLTNTSSLNHGLKYLDWASRTDSTILPLLSFDVGPDQAYHDVDERTLTAFVALLTKSSSSHFHRLLVKRRVINQDEIPMTIFADPIHYCGNLLKARKLRYRPAWHILLLALGNPNVKIHVNLGEPDLGRRQINRYRLWRSTLAEMRGTGLELDAETLRVLCVGLGQTIPSLLDIQDDSTMPLQVVEAPSAGGQLTLQSDLTDRKGAGPESEHTPNIPQPSNPISADALADISKVLKEIRPFICKIFYNLMGTKNTGAQEFHSSFKDPSSPMHPTLLAEPSPQVLHGMIRVLGFLQSWHALVELVQWMVVLQKEVLAATEMPRNGRRSLRNAIIAVRAFCERSWLFLEADATDAGLDEMRPTSKVSVPMVRAESAAPKKVIDRLRKQIDGVEGWGGWPSDEEVREYCRDRRFPSR